MATYYKLARPDGWDFYTGRSINYREAIGTMVQPPSANPRAKLCSPGILHASLRAEDCFQGKAHIPCSLYEIEGTPVCYDDTKAGFVEMRVLRELDPAKFFKWRYAKAVAPLNPLALPLRAAPSAHDLALLQQWASVGERVGTSVGTSVRESVRNSAWDSAGASVWASVWPSVWPSVWSSAGAGVWASVGASVWSSAGAYVGWIFSPVITTWQHIEHRKGTYPYMASVQLWHRGFVPSFDGTIWRLHSGAKAQVVWQGKKERLG